MQIEGVPGAQVVVQVEQADGSFACTAYGNVATARCASVVVAGAAGPTAQLGLAMDAAIMASGRDVQRIATPDHQPLEDGPQCQKLLVLVSDGANAVPDPSFASSWKSGGGDYSVLPVLPESARTSFAKLIPSAYSGKNAAYWQRSIDEVVPAVFSSAAMTVEVPRLFISYRQKESAGLAVQLFDALSHTGFDVFLDHYRIPPAVNFQERLTQELGDKAMVVVLESVEILDSEWTTYEINTAKACELTLVAVHLPGGKKVPGIDDAARQALFDREFQGGEFSPSAVLVNTKLAELVTWIEQEHNGGVLRRRGALRSAIENALAVRGVRNVVIDGAGVMHVTAAGRQYKIWPSVRSPELDDFHTASLARTPPQYGIVIGLARLFALTTRARYEWLSGVCNVAMVDKGEIAAAADMIPKGVPLP
jgi:anti-anti-sigma regulatory factor